MPAIANTNNKKNSLRTHRRCVRRQTETPDGVVLLTTKSFTNHVDTWHPNIDLRTGQVLCDCPDFTYRCARQEPSIHSETRCLCKHLVRAILNAVRRGDLKVSKAREAALETADKRTAGFSKAAPTVTPSASTPSTDNTLASPPTCFHSFLAHNLLTHGVIEETGDEEDVMLQEAWAHTAFAPCPDYLAFERTHQEAEAVRHEANRQWLAGENSGTPAPYPELFATC